ncbi:hypothetical protein OJF2_37530 [Aquisphaera giovannonii]|uniref:Uncharacterized protein n=1 Tax=Aquisphaera giovannonii TaxID=406548 RepID=A0A5B9W3L5_9BACT|nr:hypothetical protein [Aquisphaera giovannonii]QEH35206.1 hypothetical protein OJF2_37530 [Aquisphaera giovannonii]
MFIQGADPTAGSSEMNDPHVVSLTYRVKTPPDVSFDNPPAVEGDQSAFHYRLEAGRLVATMKDHFATEREARDCVEEFLRAWELDAALKADKSEFRFAFQQSHVIDRKPTSARGKVMGVMDMFVMSDEAKVEKVKTAYPAPPSGLKPSLDTETMWHHYNRFLEDREKITSMGFYCLSLLQWRTGSKKARQAVAGQYKIQKDVLDTLGTLTSDVGDLTTARKLESSSQVRSHTAKEVDWIKAAVKALIRRKAEYDHDPTATLSEITMSDLPQI